MTCASRAPQPPTPEGMALDVVSGSPAHRHLLAPGAACELARGHSGPHRAGVLRWHAPPIVVNRPPVDDRPVVFSWEASCD